MIDKISVSVDKNQYSPKNSKKHNANAQPNFTGIGDFAMKAIQLCEKEPMVNVTALDLSTAIIPRSIVETVVVPEQKDENGKKKKKQFNFFAGFEALRRESSGLIVNCILPSFIVMGAAKLLKYPVLGKDFSKADFVHNWSNTEALKKIETFYGKTDANAKLDDRIASTFRNMLNDLEGLDGKDVKSFDKILDADKDHLDSVVERFKKLVTGEKFSKKESKAIYEEIVNKTHIGENIRFKSDNGKYFSSNLQSLCDDTARTLRGIYKENITDASKLTEYFKKASKMVNVKSLAGLGIIIPLAISMQPINRWITRKNSGCKGAPMSADFQNKQDAVMSSKDKADLLRQKFISIGSMVGVAMLSMMKIPTLSALKEMVQFKGIFPSMDQARLISTATFASRMGASEDANELREATIRDIATFSSFYFLGDYAAKAIATGIEAYRNRLADKTGDESLRITLLNRHKVLDKNANVGKKFWNWVKNTSLKSTDEFATKSGKTLRSYCQWGNIAFSLLSLGLFIPLYTRTQTNKKEQEKLAKKNAEKAALATEGSTTATATETATGSTAATFGRTLPTQKPTAFKAFFNS